MSLPNLPNSLTLGRIFLVPIVVAVLLQDDWTSAVFGEAMPNEVIALILFLIAASTDLLDGYLARKWSQVTTVGTLLDPIADKLLISAALISMVQMRVVPAWMTILIIAREFAVSGLRSIAAAEGYAIGAGQLGKVKMVAQATAVALLIGSMQWSQLRPVAMGTMWVVLVVTVASGADYFIKFWNRVDSSIKVRRRVEVLELAKSERRQRVAERQGRAFEASGASGEDGGARASDAGAGEAAG